MALIGLPTTRFELEVPFNLYYHDDGEVRSIAAHYRKLCKRYNRDYPVLFPQGVFERLVDLLKEVLLITPLTTKMTKKFITVCKGHYAVFRANHNFPLKTDLDLENEVNVHTYVLAGLEKEESLMYRGHEETHFLLECGRFDIVKSELKKIGVSDNGLIKLIDEAKCDLGGLCAVLREKDLNNFRINVCPDRYARTDFLEYLGKNTSWRISSLSKKIYEISHQTEN